MKRRIAITLVGTIMGIVAAHAVAASETIESSSARTLRIPRASSAPSLESVIAGRAPEGLKVTGFRQREPNDGAPVSKNTTAYLSYDDKNIYAVFVCEEDAGNLRAHMTRREDFSGDDFVSISLDTFHDHHRAYQFFVNPHGVQMDGMTTEGQEDDYDFDAYWHSEGRVLKNGYAVLISIPFRSLRFSNQPGATWGIALGRSIPANKELSTWPLLSEKMEAYVPQFATLAQPLAERTSRNMTLTSYVYYAGQQFLQNGASSQALYRNQSEMRAGLDAKVVLHDAFTFDFTANPDFSQVESDEPQETVNRRYEVYYPERRPFFTESSGFFQTPETLLFTRRILDPQFGARMTSKIGGWTLGALAVDDRGPGNLDGSGLRTLASVARAQYEFNKASSMGFLLTRREFGSDTNQVASLDSRIKLNGNWVLTAQVARGTDNFLGAQAAGSMYFANIEQHGNHFNFYSIYRDLGAGFTSRLGFIPRTDIRQSSSSAAYRWKPENSKVVSYGPNVTERVTWDHQGVLQDWLLDTPFWMQFKGPASIGVGHTESFERYLGLGFRKHMDYGYVSTEKLRWMGLSASISSGNEINFDPVESAAPFLGKSTEASFTATFKIARGTKIEGTYLLSRLASASGTQGVFNNHISRVKVSHQFTRSLAVRAILDYNSLLANPLTTTVLPSKRLTSDVLVSWMPHPGTAVHVGYSDMRENLLADGTPNVARGFSGIPTSRQFFVKISYAFRY